jgi:hypothetical protein
MSAKSNTFENELLKHIFQNLAIPLVGDATGLPASAGAGQLFVSLHTADPGEAGTQSSSETAYTGYVRVGIDRSLGGWSVTDTAGVNEAKNVAAITFPQCGATGATITHFGIGTSNSGAGKLLYKGAMSANLSVSNGITPEFAANSLVVSEE